MKNPNYECARCKYKTDHKYDMVKHFQRIKMCPATKKDIELTNEIKQYILDNRVYTYKQGDTDKKIKKLEEEIQYLKNKKSEEFYQKLLGDHLKGTHLKMKGGTTDITTDSFHAEIKEWINWKYALGQIIAYNTEVPRDELRIYLFGKVPKKDLKAHIIDMCLAQEVVPYEIDATTDRLMITDLATDEEFMIVL